MFKRRQPRLAAIVIAVALLLNAWIHFRLAGPFDANPGSLLSQGALFRIQAVVNLIVAVLIVVRPRAWTALLAFAVAAGGAAILTLTSVVPVDGSIVGLPYLFEPAWYPAKQTSLVFQLLAAALAVGMMLHAVRTRRPVAL